MARLVHIAVKVEDLEKATKFYEDIFGIYQTKTGHARGHTSRHMTDGNIDLALMVYDSEDEKEAQLMGTGPCIHHIGIEVEDRAKTVELIEANGGKIFSDREEGALKFRAPDGILAEIVEVGRYKTRGASEKSKIVHIALKVMDLEQSTRFWANVFGFKQGKTSYDRGHYSRHMSDGHTDFALMTYDSEQAEEATWAGTGPRIHHWGLEVKDREGMSAQIEAHGGQMLSKAPKGAWKFRAPDGTLAEIVEMGRYEKMKAKAAAE